MQPVSIPASATAFLNLETRPGWTKQSGPAITGPGAVIPATWNINQVVPPLVQPPTTLTLETAGIKGSWADWMAKAPPIAIPATATNCLLRASYIYNSVQGIQASEVGWRGSNAQKVTNNGQAQLVPLSNGKLEFDIVPSAAGGWKDTGLRYPLFVAEMLNSQEQYYTMGAGAEWPLSMQYMMLNGLLQAIPADCQNIAGAVQNPPWAPLEAVPAFQEDANPTGIPFARQVTLSLWFW
jgi:hypothetical protein